MALPVPTVAELATFSGRLEATYSAFATQALLQSTLLFSMLTEITDTPSDANEAQMVANAIMEMADHLYLVQPFVEIKAKPFQSETMGSYSYSVGSAASKAMSGDKTGLLWWDLCLKLLGQKTTITSNEIIVFDRDGNLWTDSTGNTVLVGPAEVGYYGLDYNPLGYGYPSSTSGD